MAAFDKDSASYAYYKRLMVELYEQASDIKGCKLNDNDYVIVDEEFCTAQRVKMDAGAMASSGFEFLGLHWGSLLSKSLTLFDTIISSQITLLQTP